MVPPSGLVAGEVRLRAVHRADADWLVAASGDDDVVRFTDVPASFTTDAASAWIERRVDGWRQGWRASFVVEHGSVKAGYINLRVNWGSGSGELGYWLLAAHRGRGVMQSAVRLVCDWSFDVVGIARLQATVQPINVASLAVLDRAGFTREGILRSSDVLKGQRYDHWMLSLLVSDPRP
jgi:RimJ/RimL family protein N-acetyltransferase